jgi:hypothetical protein
LEGQSSRAHGCSNSSIPFGVSRVAKAARQGVFYFVCQCSRILRLQWQEQRHRQRIHWTQDFVGGKHVESGEHSTGGTDTSVDFRTSDRLGPGNVHAGDTPGQPAAKLPRALDRFGGIARHDDDFAESRAPFGIADLDDEGIKLIQGE